MKNFSRTRWVRLFFTRSVNNPVARMSNPDGSTTTTVYDSMQRVTSTVEKTAGGTVISGFEYTYDDLSKIVEEKVLANSWKICYTYDNLSRVTERTVKNLSDNTVLSSESFSYDAAGNITDAPGDCFQYDVNNRLSSFCGNAVTYDLDGNMLSNGFISCTYDSTNKLVSAGGHTYTYNAEDIRIRNLSAKDYTTYTYDTNCALSKLLCKTTNGIVTKYVYGDGLIGEETDNNFKTYHFDSRGSTVAITDTAGNITDTLAYNTYGKLTTRTGTSKVIFCYNGRDGVITDDNSLIYMRARYYSPDMRRFVNADIIHGDISDSTSLNRYAYVNGDPVSFVDPLGLSVLAMLGIMAIGGVVGGLIDGVSSIVTQAVTKGEVNWTEVGSDAAWGFVSGAVGASPLGLTGKVVADSLISLGSQMTKEYIYADNKENGEWLKDVNYIEIGVNIVIDAGFSYLSGPGVNSKNKLANQSNSIQKRIQREKRRANAKVGSRRVKSLESRYAYEIIIDPLVGTIIPGKYDILHGLVSAGVNKIMNIHTNSSRK